MSIIAVGISIYNLWINKKQKEINKKSFIELLINEIEYNINILNKIDLEIDLAKCSRYSDPENVKKKIKHMKFSTNTGVHLEKYPHGILSQEEKRKLLDFYADLKNIDKEYWDNVNIFNEFIIESDVTKVKEIGEKIKEDLFKRIT